MHPSGEVWKDIGHGKKFHKRVPLDDIGQYQTILCNTGQYQNILNNIGQYHEISKNIITTQKRES